MQPLSQGRMNSSVSQFSTDPILLHALCLQAMRESFPLHCLIFFMGSKFSDLFSRDLICTVFPLAPAIFKKQQASISSYSFLCFSFKIRDQSGRQHLYVFFFYCILSLHKQDFLEAVSLDIVSRLTSHGKDHATRTTVSLPHHFRGYKMSSSLASI